MQTLTLKDPDIRSCEELLSVLADPDCRCKGPVYEMFRGLSQTEEDKKWLYEHQIRYDVTRIPGREICGEWVKTKGHYHPKAPDGASYPEIYEVLEGEALYLLQKQDLLDIILVTARKGDLVLIPPEYGHITINPSKETLLMANLVSSAFSSEYLPFEELQGAAYYLLSYGRIEKNPRYTGEVAPIRRVDGVGKILPYPFPKRPLYECIDDAEALAFLNSPASFGDIYPDLYLFT